ncbi:MAG TPA: glutathione S-transferase family protein [Rhodanobacter sp.]|nr:glutathione S-transferase family protein [Rhodanobacter sp.]
MQTWLFAALNSIEAAVQQLAEIDLFHRGEAQVEQRRPQVVAFVKRRLEALAVWLGDREYLVGRTTVADLLRFDVLRDLQHTDQVSLHPTLKTYCERCQARPAFQKALRDRLADFAPDPVIAWGCPHSPAR